MEASEDFGTTEDLAVIVEFIVDELLRASVGTRGITVRSIAKIKKKTT